MPVLIENKCCVFFLLFEIVIWIFNVWGHPFSIYAQKGVKPMCMLYNKIATSYTKCTQTEGGGGHSIFTYKCLNRY